MYKRDGIRKPTFHEHVLKPPPSPYIYMSVKIRLFTLSLRVKSEKLSLLLASCWLQISLLLIYICQLDRCHANINCKILQDFYVIL